MNTKEMRDEAIRKAREFKPYVEKNPDELVTRGQIEHLANSVGCLLSASTLGQAAVEQITAKHAAQIAALEEAICPRVAARLTFLERQLKHLEALEERVTIAEHRVRDVKEVLINHLGSRDPVPETEHAPADPVPETEHAFADPVPETDKVSYGGSFQDFQLETRCVRIQRILGETPWHELPEEARENNRQLVREIIKVIDETK